VLKAVTQLCRDSGEEVTQTLTRQASTWFVQFLTPLRNEQHQTPQHQIERVAPECMLREISEALETIASERPLLIILEDLHWVDHSTVDLISALARDRRPTKLMLIGTYRPVDLVVYASPLKPLNKTC
jgi:predicted ATPase